MKCRCADGASVKVVVGLVRCFKYTPYLFAAIMFWTTQANAQIYDCSTTPFEATYDPNVAYAYEQQCGNTLPTLNIPTLKLPAPPVNFVGIHEASQTVFVNGMQFHVKDYKSAIESQKALDWPITPLPAGFRPIGPNEYKGYIKQSRYHIEHPIKGKIKSVMNSIKWYFRNNLKEYERIKSNAKKNVDQCYAIAENMFPGDDDAVIDYAQDCVDDLMEGLL